MRENKMGNRGSKSVFGNTVKEQRVYGSSIGTLLSSPRLRCTLMGFKRNYPVRIPSNQLNNLRSYSTANSRVANSQIGGYLLKPYFVTGFTDTFSRAQHQFSTKRSCSNNLCLVVWGANLTSLVGKGRLTKQERNMVKIAPYQMSVIIGLLLSDGWLTIATKTSKNARLGFKQSLSRSAYVWFVFNILSHYCSSSPQLIQIVRSVNPQYALQFFTRSLLGFTELHTNFYIKSQTGGFVKIVPQNIYELLTPVALAHLIMGDGYRWRHGLVLCTDSYSVEDIVRLMNVLIIKYRLECRLRYHTPTQPRVYIREGSMPILRDLIRPFMIKSMLYKID